jgi:hypothetical protein
MNEPHAGRRSNAFTGPGKTMGEVAAAGRLGPVHPAICLAIRTLEEAAGCRLFAKVGKKQRCSPGLAGRFSRHLLKIGSGLI